MFPLLHMFALSFSSNSAAAGWVTIFPVDFSLEAYQYILSKPEFIRSFGVSVLCVLLGTTISVALTILCAYPMSQPDHKFYGRKFYVGMFLITMVFNGGLIPTFLVVKAMLKNNLTTCVENYVGERSDCHAWGSLLLHELPGVILGVRPGAPGFEKVQIAPVPGYLDWAKGDVVTPRGMVHVEWKKENGKVQLSYRVPEELRDRVEVY